ncbi:MAG: site-specific tyrosine recombinase XerC [Akkermansiaceae bacterium]|nr:site-specific tyrosine recombinase XerC [Akkermansiaceae bacterium]
MKKNRIDYTRAMRGRRKGGLEEPEADGLDRTAPDTLASLTDAWLSYMEQRNYAARTLEKYRWSMRVFTTWAEERDLTKPETVTRPHLESFQRWLYRYRKKNGQPLGVTTQRARLGAVQTFFAHLCKNNLLPANPAADLDLPRKQHRQLPKGLSREDLTILLHAPDIRDPLGIRDRAILETLYATAARRSELVNLDLADLDRQGSTIHIREGKGGKSRLVPVGKSALHWLERYLDETRPRLVLDNTEQALFLSGYGERISPGYLGNWVSRTIKAAGISRRGGCHLLRHSCATHMLENGADIRLIQQLLGHARLDTTSIYTEVAITHLKEVYNRTHPAAK